MANFTSIRQETSTRKQERNTWQLSDRLTWALGLSVKPSTKLVAVAIAHHAGKTSGLAWPSLATIAATTGLSRRQVVYAIHALEAGEHLAVSRLKVGKKNAANRYRLPRMGGAQVTLPPSAEVSLPSAEVALPPSAQVAPEPVRTLEPVKEPKQQRATILTPVQDKRKKNKKRNYCEIHKRSWPGQYGEVCFLCDRESLKPKSATGSVRAVFRAKGITAEDDAAYDERQTAFRAKMSRFQTLRSSDGRTRKIDQERRARLSPA